MQAWRTRALTIGACLSALAAVAGALPFAWSWQEAIDLELLFRARGARPAPAEVVLVPIDGRAANSLFLPAAPQEFERCADVLYEARPGYRNLDPPEILTRWPRCLHARALEALAAAQPELVVMDISFRPRTDPGAVCADQDRQLAAAMRSAGKVVLIRKIRADERGGSAAQPIAEEIEAAALANAPFLLMGERLQRADKFCTFMDDARSLWPCLPAVAHQIASLDLYQELRGLLDRAGSKDIDLIPAATGDLLSQGALHVPVTLIRRLVLSDRLRLDVIPSAGLRRLTEIYRGPATRYFNFYGPPGAFQTLRYEALVEGANAHRLAPGSLRGKILFIGFAEHRIAEPIEHFTTPFTTAEGVKLSGVELAATAYANLRDGSAILPAAPWARALLSFTAGLLCTALFVWLRPLPGIGVCAACALAYFGGAFIAFDRYAAWLPLVAPLGAALPGAATGLAAHLIAERRTKQYFSRVIAMLLPRPQAKRIIEKQVPFSDLQSSGPGLSINTDIARYTEFTEKHSAEEVVRFIGPYFRELRQIAEDHGVYAIDFAGDSMMASWADTTADHALRERICTAALELAAAAEKRRLAHPRDPLSTRLGMSYGTVKFTMIGDAIKAVGEPPNTAQRLQAFNESLGTRVLVDEAVIEGLDGILVRDVGCFLLHKKTKPTRVYELVGLRSRLTSEKAALQQKFGEALAAYRTDRQDEAKALFDALAPTDGPSAYYAGLCAKGIFLKDHPISV